MGREKNAAVALLSVSCKGYVCTAGVVGKGDLLDYELFVDVCSLLNCLEGHCTFFVRAPASY